MSLPDTFSPIALNGHGMPLNPPSGQLCKKASPSARSARRAPETRKPREGKQG